MRYTYRLHTLDKKENRRCVYMLLAPINTVFLFCLPDSGRQCWCFGSNGLQALGQRELVFLLECLPEEKTLPQDLFTLYLTIYQDAQKGRRHLLYSPCVHL